MRMWFVLFCVDLFFFFFLMKQARQSWADRKSVGFFVHLFSDYAGMEKNKTKAKMAPGDLCVAGPWQSRVHVFKALNSGVCFLLMSVWVCVWCREMYMSVKKITRDQFEHFHSEALQFFLFVFFKWHDIKTYVRKWTVLRYPGPNSPCLKAFWWMYYLGYWYIQFMDKPLNVLLNEMHPVVDYDLRIWYKP